MIQTFIQESGRFIEESCSKFDVIFLLSKNKIVTIITLPFNICNFSYNKSYYYHSKVLCFRTNCLFCDEDLVSCLNIHPNHIYYTQ